MVVRKLAGVYIVAFTGLYVPCTYLSVHITSPCVFSKIHVWGFGAATQFFATGLVLTTS